MTREDTKKILDKVLDMGESPYHNVGVSFTTNESAIFCTLYIHFKAPRYSTYSTTVCDSKSIYTQSEDVQPFLNWLDVWAVIFKKERELDETDGR